MIVGDTEVTEHEIVIRLTAEGKLPRTIVCPTCFRDMRRKFWRTDIVYGCIPCDSETLLELTDEQRKKIL
jgi:hypothetical protein